MTHFPVTAPIQSPTSTRETRVDRFLARVGALTPRQWGELDAIGQRFEASDPVAWWHRAHRLAAFASAVPVLEDVMAVVGFVGVGIQDVVRSVRGRRHARPRFVRPRRLPPNAESQALLGRIETLWDMASAQPGGAGASFDCLVLGLSALWSRELLSERGFTQIYALVEPVIPAASL